MSLFQLLRRHKPYERAKDVIAVLVYEIGDVVKCIHYMENFPQDRKAYIAELRKAMADVFIQMKILCEMYDFSLSELFEEGHDEFVQMLKERFPVK